MLIYYIHDGYRRPGALRSLIGADRRKLNNQLQEFVRQGFNEKVVFETKVPKVEYALTVLGESLLPLIIDLEA